MNRRSASIVLIAAALAMAPLGARADMFGSLTGALPGGSGSPGGASFSSTGSLMSSQVLVGLNSTLTAVQLMEQAVGNKRGADALQAAKDALARDPSSSTVEQSFKTVDDNPVERGQLAKVQDAKSKQLLVQSAGNVGVAGIFNAKAVDSARHLVSMKPGISDAMSAPSLLRTANVVVTAVPAQLQHIANYAGMLASYMKDNKLTPPSMDDQRKIAMKNGSDQAAIAANMP